MLYQNATDIVQTNEADLLPGEIVSEEGQALVWAREGGKSFLKVSTGTPGEVLAGFALARSMPPAYQAKIDDFVIDSTLSYTAAKLPIAGQIFVKIDGAKADIEVGAAASAAGKVAVEGANFHFHADDEDKEVYVQFAYLLNAVEARHYTADAPVGGLATNVMGRVGYIKLGNITTNLFDSSVDWTADNVLHPSLGADGRLTLGGNGTKLTGCIIKAAPTSESGYLTIEMTTSYGQ